MSPVRYRCLRATLCERNRAIRSFRSTPLNPIISHPFSCMRLSFTSALVAALLAATAAAASREHDERHSCHEVIEELAVVSPSSRIEACSAPPHACTFAEAGRRTSCEQTCYEAGGLACAEAWDDQDDDGLCPAGLTIACNRAMHSKVCKCARPFCQSDDECLDTRRCVGGRCRRADDCDTDDSCGRSEPIRLAGHKKRGRGHNRSRGAMHGANAAAHQCELLSREILTTEDLGRDNQYAVHRLHFAMPLGGKVPGTGPVHVKVRAPDARGQRMRVRAYSAYLEDSGGFSLTVKIYPGGPPSTRGTSAYLGAVSVGSKVWIPQVRSVGWAVPLRSIQKVGLVAFGVGIAEMLEPLEHVLLGSSEVEVRLIYATRNEKQIIYRPWLRRLLASHAGRFSVLHCLSRQGYDSGNKSGTCAKGEEIQFGRITESTLQDTFGEWADSETFFMVVGTRSMENYVQGWLRSSGLGRSLIQGGRWMPLVPVEEEEEEEGEEDEDGEDDDGNSILK